VDGLGHGLARAVRVTGECLADRGRSPGDRLAVLGRGQPRSQFLRLAGAQSRVFDLGDLVREQVDPAGELARIHRELRERRPVRAPALYGSRHGSPQCIVPAVGVQQVALPALVEQPLLIVLAVDLDERPDLLGEP
jgi:hypothetical protein